MRVDAKVMMVVKGLPEGVPEVTAVVVLWETDMTWDGWGWLAQVVAVLVVLFC